MQIDYHVGGINFKFATDYLYYTHYAQFIGNEATIYVFLVALLFLASNPLDSKHRHHDRLDCGCPNHPTPQPTPEKDTTQLSPMEHEQPSGKIIIDYAAQFMVQDKDD